MLRAATHCALGNANDAERDLRSIIAMGDEAWTVRSAAAEALGRLGRAAATAEVLDALAQTACSPEANGRDFEDAAYRALSGLLVYYRPGNG